MSTLPSWTRGPLIPVETEILPTIEFDCSDWVKETPEEPWTRGPLILVEADEKITLELEMQWFDIPDFRLALTLEALSNDTINNGVALIQLVDSINTFDRKLGGVGMKLDSSSRDNGTLTLLLAPVDPNGAAERIRRIVDAVNGATDIARPAALSSIHARSA